MYAIKLLFSLVCTSISIYAIYLQPSSIQYGQLAVFLVEVKVMQDAEGDHGGGLVADLQVTDQLLDLE